MRPQGVQQWRPKAKIQCVSEAVELNPSTPSESATAVIKEAEKLLEKVSSSLEVNQVVVQSMKKQRGKLKRKIETETQTLLSISKRNLGYIVVVEGASDAAVEKATKRLQSLLEKADNKTQEKVVGALKPQTAQWIPKAVRGLHTSVEVEKMKDVAAELDDDAEKISGAIQVDKKLLRLIKGDKCKGIEKDTNTVIRIGSPVVVEGTSEDSVQKALAEIQKIIDEGVNDWKFQYSHFISLPLSQHPSLVKQLEKFQESVLIDHGVHLTEANNGEESEKKSEVQVQVMVEATGDQPVSEVAQQLSAAGAGAMEVELGDPSQDAGAAVDEASDQTGVATDAVFKNTVMISLGMPVEMEHQTELGNETTSSCEAEQKTEITGHELVAEEKPEQKMILEEQKVAVVEEKLAEKASEKPEEDEAEEQQKKEYEPLADVGFSTKKTGGSGIEKSIFIKPSRFHLTVLMLKLWNEERIEKARQVLESCLPKVAEVLDDKPVSVSLTGLEIMKGSPKNTRVLFAKVRDTDGEDRLAKACQVIIDEFVEAGLVLDKDQEQALKLHATVMNTSHRRSKSKYRNKGFDASEILSKFGDEVWGDYEILEAHLSERFKYDENDYYHCCGSIKFPARNFT